MWPTKQGKSIRRQLNDTPVNGGLMRRDSTSNIGRRHVKQANDVKLPINSMMPCMAFCALVGRIGRKRNGRLEFTSSSNSILISKTVGFVTDTRDDPEMIAIRAPFETPATWPTITGNRSGISRRTLRTGDYREVATDGSTGRAMAGAILDRRPKDDECRRHSRKGDHGAGSGRLVWKP